MLTAAKEEPRRQIPNEARCSRARRVSLGSRHHTSELHALREQWTWLALSRWMTPALVISRCHAILVEDRIPQLQELAQVDALNWSHPAHLAPARGTVDPGARTQAHV